jgi:hypothetical protein
MRTRRRDHSAAGLAPGCDLLVAEYASLKDEQRLRIGTRDNLLYATLAALAGVLTVTFSAHRAAYLLLTPPVSLILGWTYLANDVAISAIGRYIRDSLAPRLAELTGATAPVLGWEAAHRSDGDRAVRKAGQLAVDLLAFVFPPAAAVAAYWVTGPGPVLLTLASAAETAAVVLLAARIIQCADLEGAA